MSRVESHYSPLDGGPVEFQQETLTPDEAAELREQVEAQGGRVDIQESTIPGMHRTTVILPVSSSRQHVVPSEFR